ncbi:MAG: DUF2290 domain-containing protein [Clostridia bacterium]|nr:DUF2290 domain-containing protein [Clostridia bacterium]
MMPSNIINTINRDIENVREVLFEWKLIKEMKETSIKCIGRNKYVLTWHTKNSTSNIIYDNDIDVDVIMKELLKNEQYSIILYDRSIIQFEFIVENNEIIKQRLLFIKKHNKILDKEDIADIENTPDTDFFDYFFEDKGIPTMLRVDMDKENHEECIHPISHMTISNNKTCRIPMKGIISCTEFIKLILLHFYGIKVENKQMNFNTDTIVEAEKRMIHLNWN